jgi:hypothetical protein
MATFDFTTKAPGVFTQEIDQSVILPQVPELGPIIIGRTRKGPAGVPVNIAGLDNYNEIFGKPYPGAGAGDVWRFGPSGPTYAGYAAHAWLASETTPINVVRLLGEQKATTGAGRAGWDAANAYGLFIINSGSETGSLEAEAGYASSHHRGALAAVFYTTSDYVVALSGATAGETGGQVGARVRIDIKEGLASGSAGHTFSILDGNGTEKVFFITTTGSDSAATTGNFVNGDQVAVRLPEFGSASVNRVAEEIAQAITSSGDNKGFGSAVTVARTGSLIEITTTPAGAAGNSARYTSLTAHNGFHSHINAVSASRTVGEITMFEGGDDGTANNAHPAEVIAASATNFEFIMSIQSSGSSGIDQGVEVDKVTFNFNRSSEKYIRNVFNTDPTRTNTTITPANGQKGYWLGESFERFASEVVTGSTAASVNAVILPLASGSTTWADHRQGFTYAKSGYFISQDHGGTSNFSDFTAQAFSTTGSNVEKLFRICGLGGGEADHNYFIAIEDLKLPTDPVVNPFGSFTLSVMEVGTGRTLEKFPNLNLDATSNDFVAKRIGSMYQTWDNDEGRYRWNADEQFMNVSSYIRIEMYGGEAAFLTNGLLHQNSVPFGYFGPVRPKRAIIHSASILTSEWIGSTGRTSASQGSFVINHGLQGGGQNTAATGYTASLAFPSFSLRRSGSDGLVSKPQKAYFGIQPTIDSSARTFDDDYIDLCRPFTTASILDYDSKTLYTNTDAVWEYSFIFSLDHVRLRDEDPRSLFYDDKSRDLGASYTAVSGAQKLIDKDVKRFYAPLVGGFDGLDVTEQEPFGNHLLSSTSTDTNSYVHYTLNKALRAVSDPEVVPANLLLVPGQQEAVITDKIVSVADPNIGSEGRGDLLSIIDLKYDYTPATETPTPTRGDFDSLKSTFNSRRNIDSSYGCAFYPAVQVVDRDTGLYVWVPASVAALGAFAQSQRASELWFAPAGFNRGGLGNLGGRRGPTVLQTRQRLDSSQRDDLYNININPIASFPNEGVVIFGQKTLQRTQSALDRINVRRLMIFLKQKIGDIAKLNLFEQNNNSTRAQLSAEINALLGNVKSRFGLSDYNVILDDTNNTALDIDNNVLNVSIFVKPTRAIEYIAIDFIITRSGVEFA